ncbi:metallophosphatase domain-containing protein [Marinospirillum perlucidum]|uniref:metallophosphatase domain-containing protein n=1 Tax=Marinospirillum perlucidum TaxID=1982602 RepID=UPI000DF4A07F|nr:metallophosphatase domain-containing protein [Marinospirillum perlucidum]
MRLVMLSDTHGRHRDIQVPGGDLLIHAGDFSSGHSWEELEEFADWFRAQPHAHKVVVAGNHDLLMESDPEAGQRLFAGWAHYLKDKALTLEGIQIYGSPWTPRFFDYAFMLPRGSALAECWRKIPEATQLLITHGPAQGLGDLTFTGVRAGCEALTKRLKQLEQLKLHLFGHIHEGHGIYQPTSLRPYTSINASSCRWSDAGLNPPLCFDWT